MPPVRNESAFTLIVVTAGCSEVVLQAAISNKPAMCKISRFMACEVNEGIDNASKYRNFISISVRPAVFIGDIPDFLSDTAVPANSDFLLYLPA